jgi:hypothetical protein
MGLEAIAAVHGAISTGLEGHLGGAAAAIADHFVHLTGAIVAAVGVTASGAASGATAGLVLEALLGKESLLRSGKHKFGAAVTALEGLVLIHGGIPPKNCCTLYRVPFSASMVYDRMRDNQRRNEFAYLAGLTWYIIARFYSLVQTWKKILFLPNSFHPAQFYEKQRGLMVCSSRKKGTLE